jgi:hypothetical protein
MKFYSIRRDRLVDTAEMIAKYGTNKAIPQLGIYDLSIQPDYIPIGFNRLLNGTYYPVQSYLLVKYRAEQALVAAGYSETEATNLLN